jgi:hypothetical protein
MHREAAGSARLHLFQELSTLGQQLAHTLLLCQGLRGMEPMFPARTPRPRQPFSGARSGAGAPMHTAPSVCHCRGLTCRASAGPGSAPRGGIRVSDRIAISQPTSSSWAGSLIRLSHRLKPFPDLDGLPARRSPDHRQRWSHFPRPSAGWCFPCDGSELPSASQKSATT